MSEKVKYNLSDLNEDNINDFFICRICRKIVHRNDNPTRGNFECVYTENCMDSTIVVECEQCVKTRIENLQRKSNRDRLSGFLKYFSKEQK
jgi:hypothetical protein